MPLVSPSGPLTLVTGASGFIGGQIARLLAAQGRPLRLLLRKNSSTKHLEGINFEPVTGDLRNYGAMPAVILNPTGPIGPGDVRPTPTSQMVCDFAKGKIPFYVDAHFSMVDVRDAALGHLLAEQKGKIGERYILCGENLSAKKLFEMMAKSAGKKAPTLKLPIPVIKAFAAIAEPLADYVFHRPPLITKPYAALLPYYFWFDNSKSKKELGLTYRPVSEAIQDAITWFRAEGYIS